MKTPLHDAIFAFISKDSSRFHMPGHKGVGEGPLGSMLPYDITELPGLESLYEGRGAIAETEALYAKLYGTKASLLSAGGSTLCIQAMLALTCKPGDKLVIGRNAHRAAVSAMALLDIEPVWLPPERDEETGLSRPVSPELVRRALERNPDAAAVYLTSPDYYGVLTDIKAVAEVCREFHTPLLVDNAHGAHLRFCGGFAAHPMELGADLCCDSLHKTLPALTGAALLHIANERFVPGAKQAMALFGSTSPSFPVLLSADLLLPWLAKEAKAELSSLCGTVCSLADEARERGFLLPQSDTDPIRLTLGFSALGYNREAFGRLLAEYKITPEYLDGYYAVLLAGVRNTPRDFGRLRALTSSACRQGPPLPLPPELILPERVCSVREAVFAPSVEIPTGKAAGRIAASVHAACPPGVPVVVPGEEISSTAASLLKKSGISIVNVLQ